MNNQPPYQRVFKTKSLPAVFVLHKPTFPLIEYFYKDFTCYHQMRVSVTLHRASRNVVHGATSVAGVGVGRGHREHKELAGRQHVILAIWKTMFHSKLYDKREIIPAWFCVKRKILPTMHHAVSSAIGSISFIAGERVDITAGGKKHSIGKKKIHPGGSLW